MPYTKEFLKERYALLPRYIEMTDRYIQKVTADAYRNVRLVSNEVLSRNPHSNRFFQNVLFQKSPRSPRWTRLIGNILRYYVLSLFHLTLYVSTYAMEKIRHRPVTTFQPRPDEPVYLVDTLVLIDRMLEENQFTDYYLGHTCSILRSRGKSYVILPRFYGRMMPSRIAKIYRLLEAAGHPYINEFQLLTWTDLLRALWFIGIQPWDTMKLAFRLPKQEAIDRLFSEELLNTLHLVNFHNYIRYWVGKRAGTLWGNKLFLISWNENQTIDKNLYRGIKESAPQTYIYGCQLFIAYPALINERPAESEKQFGVTPDCVLVNGTAYLRSTSAIKYRLGISARYLGVFDTRAAGASKNGTAIFLTYHRGLNAEIVRMASNVPAIRDQATDVRPHPANRAGELPALPPRWKWTNEDRYAMLARTSILITSESSAAVEAAALNTSVIIIASQESFTCNPMLPLGQGELWDIAFDSGEIQAAYERLMDVRVNRPERVAALSEAYKTQCFVEPTEDNFTRAFELSA